MQISNIKTQNFTSATLVQNPEKKFSSQSGKYNEIQIGKQEALRTYDSAIEKLQEKKYIAKQLHNFMNSKEGQACLEKCPDGDIVQLSTKLDVEEDFYGNMTLSQPSLCYEFHSKESAKKADELGNRSHLDLYEVETKINENGMEVLDTDGIKNWFENIYNILKK